MAEEKKAGVSRRVIVTQQEGLNVAGTVIPKGVVLQEGQTSGGALKAALHFGQARIATAEECKTYDSSATPTPKKPKEPKGKK